MEHLFPLENVKRRTFDSMQLSVFLIFSANGQTVDTDPMEAGVLLYYTRVAAL